VVYPKKIAAINQDDARELEVKLILKTFDNFHITCTEQFH